MTVTFDSTNIITSPYYPEFIGHESAPDRQVSLVELAREDGSVVISERYGVKRITIRGILTGSSQAVLEAAIDTFKELFSRVNKNLDIGWGSGTRRYVATCERHNFDRQYFMMKYVPWTAEFVVPAGIGEDTSETNYLYNESFVAASFDDEWTFAGSAKPKPRIRVRCANTITAPKGVSIENTDTGERIVVTRSAGFDANVDFEVDCRLKTVKYNSLETGINWYGVFPTFDVGANNIQIKIGQIIDQTYELSTAWGSTLSVFTDVTRAQSFSVPYRDTTYQAISLLVSKTGTPTSDLKIRIFEDDGTGKPNMAAQVTNANGDISAANIGASLAWVTLEFGNAITLKANTKYWIVPTATGSAGNQYNIAIDNAGTYPRGNTSYTADGGSNWSDEPNSDFAFRLMYGGQIDATKTYYVNIGYYKRYL